MVVVVVPTLIVNYLGEVVCGSTNLWSMSGDTLPFCQRCTGLYVGSVFAFLTCLLFRPRPTTCRLGSHGGLLLVMFPFGYPGVPQNGNVRTSPDCCLPGR